MLSIQKVTVRYRDRVAVQPTSLDIGRGTFAALVGPNGAGKSSLIKALAVVLRRAASGEVLWEDRNLAQLDSRARARTVAYLPQSPAAHWPLPVRELVALGRLPHRATGQDETPADRDSIAWAMQELELDGFASRAIDQLSGGERARVLLARALAVRAPVLLVDEPVASLDPYHQLHVMAVLQRYAASGGVVLAVLHDLLLAARFCARVILMHDGGIVGDGSPGEVLTPTALRRYYRVEAHIGMHGGQPLVVPWRRLPTQQAAEEEEKIYRSNV